MKTLKISLKRLQQFVRNLVPFIACLLLLESDDLAAFHLIDLVLLQIFYFWVI